MEFKDPYDDVVITDSKTIDYVQTLKKNKMSGCVSYDQKKKRFRAQGSRPDRKHIGFYDSKAIALSALNYFNITGKRMESNRTIRKSGTGSITKKSNKFIAKLEKIYIGIYSSEREAINAIIEFKILGKKKSLS